MWDLIVSVPDHCLSFYFSFQWNFIRHVVIMAFKVLVYSFAFKRHCNAWLLETLAILVKAYQRNILFASIIRQLFKLCFRVTDLFLHTGHSTS